MLRESQAIQRVKKQEEERKHTKQTHGVKIIKRNKGCELQKKKNEKDKQKIWNLCTKVEENIIPLRIKSKGSIGEDCMRSDGRREMEGQLK